MRARTVPREGAAETVASAPGENDGSLVSDDGSGDGEKSADGRVT